MRSALSKTLLFLLVLGSAVPALATPVVNSAVLHPRVFDDFSDSTLTQGDAYPSSMLFEDTIGADTQGWANLHTWRFSANNFTDAQFANADQFSFSADLVISGTAYAEAGLQISPWWSPQVDGRLNVKVSGEIAAFGGRLPFYSFTASHGLSYVRGDTIHLEMIYDPNSLSMADPGTIEYKVTYNSVSYTSGELLFDEGNPAEGHGSWGILSPAYAGGHLQAFNGAPEGTARADWTNITFIPEPGTLALLAIGGLMTLIRRRP
ncbi:MAG: PEP-CTERM sorting domain-containing protein [Planctomycetota bacterium]